MFVLKVFGVEIYFPHIMLRAIQRGNKMSGRKQHYIPVFFQKGWAANTD